MVQIKYKDKVYTYDGKEYYNKEKVTCEKCNSIVRKHYLKIHQGLKKCIDYHLYLEECKVIENNLLNNNE